jgi:hypothetical protein
MLSCLTSINSDFDQENETGPKNDPFFNCRRKTKELSKKELSNVVPASRRISFVYSCTMLGLVNLAKARKGGFIYVKSLV